jgi:hypothetical protein
LHASFFVWDSEIEGYKAPVDSKILPLPNLQFVRHGLEINLSEKSAKSAKSGNIHAKHFCALMLLIQRRLEHPLSADQQQIPQGMEANPLVYMPLEIWQYISSFCNLHYLPQIKTTLTKRNLNELEPYYENHNSALISYHTDRDKLQIDLKASVI